MFKICILSIDNPHTAQLLLRVMPYANLKNTKISLGCLIKKFIKDQYNNDCDVQVEVNEKEIKNCDAVLIQRSFPQKSTIDIIKNIIKLKKKIIYDTDDLLVDLPEENSSPMKFLHNNSKKYIEEILPFIDIFTTTTNSLRNKLIEVFNLRNIIVAPNLIIENLYPKVNNNFKKNEYFKIIISGHQKLLEIKHILDDLKKILAFNKNVFLYFVGFNKPIEVFNNEKRVFFIAPNTYIKYLIDVNNIKPDLALVPYRNIEFNHYKTNIKFLDYSFLKIPGIYSKITPYYETIRHGINGIICNNERKWFDEITKMLNNKKELLNLANQAKITVQKKYLLRNNLDIFNNICKKL